MGTHPIFESDFDCLTDLDTRMAFTFAAFCYIAALVLTAVLIFFAIWHLIAFDELQHDYKNPVDQCNSLNPLVLPEYGCHALILVLMFSSNEISSAILNIPLLAYHIYRYSKRPVAMSKPGLYDPTSIMNRDKLNYAMYEGWCKMAFSFLTFFYYLYSMIYVLITY